MYLPVELQQIINEYAKPLTRPNNKQGSYFIRNLIKSNDVVSLSILKTYITACFGDLSYKIEFAFILNKPDLL